MKLNELFDSKSTNGKYVAFALSKESVDNIRYYIKNLNLKNPLPPLDYHVTLIGSNNNFEMELKDYTNNPIIIPSSKMFWWIFKTQEGNSCLVLRFDNKYLQERYAEATAAGAKSSFDKYLPHVTFSYDTDHNFDTIQALPVPSFDIELVKEYQDSFKN